MKKGVGARRKEPIKGVIKEPNSNPPAPGAGETGRSGKIPIPSRTESVQWVGPISQLLPGGLGSALVSIEGVC